MSPDTVIATTGTTFLVSARNGDLNEKSIDGFYSQDTRFLSQYKVLINGKETEPLGIGRYDHSILSFYSVLREQDGSSESRSSFSIVRDRLVGDAVHEDLAIMNHSSDDSTLELGLSFNSDFADVFEVRRGNFLKEGSISVEPRQGQSISFVYQRRDFRREVWISFAEEPTVKNGTAAFRIKLAPMATWKTCVNIIPVLKEAPPPAPCVSNILGSPFGHFHKQSSDSIRKPKTKAIELLDLPEIRTDNPSLKEAYYQAASDLDLLQLEIVPDQYVLAAGLPWFMAVFGRDSIISAIQTKILGTKLLTGTLRTLATLQAKTEDKFREAEPGKIPHEVRHGELSIFEKVPHSCYYGSVDSTPLYLILLAEAYQWTGDLELGRDYLKPAEAALNWIDQFGDLDGDGFVEYKERPRPGLRNQGWKDSEDSTCFASGELAESPIALSEVQGYVFAAKTRLSDLYRRLGEFEKAERLSAQARDLKKNFNQKFWMPKQQFYAMALDGRKNQVDGIASNAGHCLWSGIVDEDKAAHVVRRLMDYDMFTGWGIRTLSSEMRRYDPLSYHNGSVWPHDTSIAAAGMHRYGFSKEASALSVSLLDAATLSSDRRVPELFAGFVRRERSRPIPYPAANSPQAWASGAIIYCIETLLGITTSGDQLMQKARLEGISISLSGVKYRGISLVL